MFIRRKIMRGETYYQVVETYRDGARVRHRNIVSLGQCPTPQEVLKSALRRIKHYEWELAALSPVRYLKSKNEKRCDYLENKISEQRDKVSRLETAIKGLVVDTTGDSRSTPR